MDSTALPVGPLTDGQTRSVLTAATATFTASVRGAAACRFRCTATAIELHAGLTRGPPVVDTDRRQLLACGAALLTLRVAIRAFGVYPTVQLLPDPARPELLGIVRPGQRNPATPLDRALAQAISDLRSHRRPATTGAAAPPLANRLRQAARTEQAWLAILTPPHPPLLWALLQHPQHTEHDTPLLIGGPANRTVRHRHPAAGEPVRGATQPERHNQRVPHDLCTGTTDPRPADRDVDPDPLIAVIGTLHDAPLAHLQAGQAIQRVLLTATAAGLPAALAAQPVQTPGTRRQLRELIGGGLWPQAALRLGQATRDQ